MVTYILSHSRSNSVSTVNTLNKLKYSGIMYIVVDDEDPEIDEYKKNFSNLLIFNKKNIFDRYDSMSTEFQKSSPWYARNFILEHAKLHGYKYIIMSDDDITKFYNRFREIDDGPTKAHQINNINDVLDRWINLLETSNVSGICPAIDSSYFGGVGEFDRGFGRKVFQFMLLKVNDIDQFTGLHAEDFLLSMTNQDKLFLTDYNISFSSPQLGTNKGGVEYSSKLSDNKYLAIACPSCVKVNSKFSNYILMQDYMFPKILNEEFKNN